MRLETRTCLKHSSFDEDSWFRSRSLIVVVIVEFGLVPQRGGSVVVAIVVAKHVVVDARLYRGGE